MWKLQILDLQKSSKFSWSNFLEQEGQWDNRNWQEQIQKPGYVAHWRKPCLSQWQQFAWQLPSVTTHCLHPGLLTHCHRQPEGHSKCSCQEISWTPSSLQTPAMLSLHHPDQANQQHTLTLLNWKNLIQPSSMVTQNYFLCQGYWSMSKLH